MSETAVQPNEGTAQRNTAVEQIEECENIGRTNISNCIKCQLLEIRCFHPIRNGTSVHNDFLNVYAYLRQTMCVENCPHGNPLSGKDTDGVEHWLLCGICEMFIKKYIAILKSNCGKFWDYVEDEVINILPALKQEKFRHLLANF